ncbi:MULTISPECIES: FUSC family protein [unclassified Brevundimonas]|uniref:FUSC family protein n=1 Tax=unclassified Brevundimonas TaxID=2622653 RepID=UPI0025C013C0|nr:MULTISPECIES: FUSC family protein [unclassified Brevundimonas]
MSDRIRRRDAARMLISRRQVSASLGVARPPQWENSILAGAQAAFSVALAVSLVAVSPWSNMIGAASLGAMAALFGRFAPRSRRSVVVVYAALCMAASIGIMSLAALAGLSVPALLVLLSILGGVLLFICTVLRFGPPGALIFMFAGMAGMNPPDSLHDVGLRLAATVFGGVVAVLFCALSEFLRRGEATNPQKLPTLRNHLAELWPAILRITIGAAVAGLIAYGMGQAHPGWAAMGATAALQGVHLHTTFHRALQRVLGTIVGSVVIWMILSQEPSIWTGLVLLVALQLATEVVIGFNYALGQVFVTPMALLMTYLSNPGSSGAAMAPERVLDTILGAVIGVLIAVVISTHNDRHHLHRHHSEGR